MPPLLVIVFIGVLGQGGHCQNSSPWAQFGMNLGSWDWSYELKKAPSHVRSLAKLVLWEHGLWVTLFVACSQTVWSAARDLNSGGDGATEEFWVLASGLLLCFSSTLLSASKQLSDWNCYGGNRSHPAFLLHFMSGFFPRLQLCYLSTLSYTQLSHFFKGIFTS